MTFREAFQVIRRWRFVPLAGILLGVVVGWVSAPGTAADPVSFRATHTLILKPGRSVESNRLTEVLATLGPVPDRVAARLSLDPAFVRSAVSATARDPGVLLITANTTDGSQAQALANFTAEELLVDLGGEDAPLETLEPALAGPVPTEGIKGPTSRTGRALLLGSFGLVLGVGAALWLDRFDNRIRTKAAAEEATGLPVLAGVPSVARAERGQLVTGTQESSFFEAYRALRTSVERWASQAEEVARRVIVVTSPTGGTGSTMTVAHLAVALSEVGRSVLAISADLRRPRLHVYFGRSREPGLCDVLMGAPDARRLTDLNLATAIRGIRLVASGAPVRNPSLVLDRIGEHLSDARNLADFVLIDAPPLLATSDGPDLARHADAVLLVVRAGHTSSGAAGESTELLGRLGIPVLGAVLLGGTV